MENCILINHDYRKDVVERKRARNYWGKWDSWNILYKTLAYEICSSKHVESYCYVRKSLRSFYDERLELYVEILFLFQKVGTSMQMFGIVGNINYLILHFLIINVMIIKSTFTLWSTKINGLRWIKMTKKEVYATICLSELS